MILVQVGLDVIMLWVMFYCDVIGVNCVGDGK